MGAIADARLVARARGGDREAFERLYARHRPNIHSFCLHLTGSREDADDAVQHAFMAAYREVVQLGRSIEVRPWLFAAARNRSLSLLRARGGRVPLDPEAICSTADGPLAAVERREELRELLRDLHGLPDDQRAALVLSQLDRLSHREIGAVLEVPTAKVKALVFQARSSLLSTRAAREAPCQEIRRELATATGAALRRRRLRRHVRVCDGCRAYEAAVARQREDLALVLPLAPAAGLSSAWLGGAVGREATGATAAGGGAAASGGSTGGGLASSLGLLGVGGASKATVAAVVVAAGGVGTGAVGADLPQRVADGAEGVRQALSGPERTRPGGDGRVAPGGRALADTRPAAPRAGAKRADGSGPAARRIPGARGPDARGVGGGQPPAERVGASAPGGVPAGQPGGGPAHGGLPPGLARRGRRPGQAGSPAAPGAGGGHPGNGNPGNGNPGNGNPGNGNPGGGHPGNGHPGGGNSGGGHPGNGHPGGGNSGGGNPGGGNPGGNPGGGNPGGGNPGGNPGGGNPGGGNPGGNAGGGNPGDGNPGGGNPGGGNPGGGNPGGGNPGGGGPGPKGPGGGKPD